MTSRPEERPPEHPAPRLRRYALTVHYDGGPFHGWQIQSRSRTVQGEIEQVLLRITGARRPVVGSGRTDAGVHATGQVASVDVPERWSAAELRKAMNALLPTEIWVAEARRVAGDFHPRYHATKRSYEYRIGTDEAARSPFARRWCWPLPRIPPDVALLARAAELLPGERSFRRFARTGDPDRGERCRVAAACWEPWTLPIGPGLEARGVRLVITADRYLRHMVRYLVGTMVDVAKGRRSLAELAELLAQPDTELRTSPPAPPEGLFLTRVEYPPMRWTDGPERDPSPTTETDANG